MKRILRYLALFDQNFFIPNTQGGLKLIFTSYHTFEELNVPFHIYYFISTTALDCNGWTERELPEEWSNC